jgi:hypothetical protein
MTVRITENYIRLITMTLRTLELAATKQMCESEIIRQLERSEWTTPHERGSVTSRTDSRIANRIHNIVSHRHGSKNNAILIGLIDWTSNGSIFAITAKGIATLNRITLKLGATSEMDRSVVDMWLREQAKS